MSHVFNSLKKKVIIIFVSFSKSKPFNAEIAWPWIQKTKQLNFSLPKRGDVCLWLSVSTVHTFIRGFLTEKVSE